MTLLALAGIAAIATTSASADPNAVLSDCNSNGALTHHYSRSDLQTALNTMPADVKEYTDCYDVINRALLASASGASHGGGSAGGGASGGGSAPAGHSGSGTAATAVTAGSPAKHHHHRSSPGNTVGAGSSGQVPLANGSVQPGATGVNASSGSNSLPTPLIVVLVLLGLAALSGGGVAIRRRVVARDGP